MYNINGKTNSVSLDRVGVGTLFEAKERSLDFLHNHPSSTSFSDADIKLLMQYDSLESIYIQGENGVIYELHKGDETAKMFKKNFDSRFDNISTSYLNYVTCALVMII